MRTVSLQTSEHFFPALFRSVSRSLSSVFIFSHSLTLFWCTVITAWESSSSPVSVVWFLTLSPSLFFLSPLTCFVYPRQVLGQLHGGRAWRLHERQPPQWHAHHHPPQEVHGTHAHHLPSGQEAQAGLSPADGGGRGAGQPAGGGRPCWGSVPWVGPWHFSFFYNIYTAVT